MLRRENEEWHTKGRGKYRPEGWKENVGGGDGVWGAHRQRGEN